MDQDRVFSLEGAAEYLGGISTWTVKKLLRTGKLGKSKIGSRVVIRESQLQRVIRDLFPKVLNEEQE